MFIVIVMPIIMSLYQLRHERLFYITHVILLQENIAEKLRKLQEIEQRIEQNFEGKLCKNYAKNLVKIVNKILQNVF